MSFSWSFIQRVYSKVKYMFLSGELKCGEKISYNNMIDAFEYWFSIEIADRSSILSTFLGIKSIDAKPYQKGFIRPPYETLPEHMKFISAIKKKNIEVAELALKNHNQKDCKF